MQSQLARACTPFERIPAVDGRLLDPEIVRSSIGKCLKARLRPALTRAELGCYLSHAAAWKKVVDERHDYACIMEDDIELAYDFSYWLDRTDQYPREFDILKLEAIGKHKRRRATVISRSGRWSIGHCLSSASGAACYIVSNSGARCLLGRLLPCDSAVDTAMFRYWENKLRVYDVLPYPARQNGAPSSVQWQSDAALGSVPRSSCSIFGPHLHPIDWKPVVYALSTIERWRRLGLRSLSLRAIPAHDPWLYQQTVDTDGPPVPPVLLRT